MATITVNRPNFLASEVGLITKTAGADASTNSSIVTTETDQYGVAHSIIKAGALYNSTDVKGIVFQDVDVTGSTATTKVAIPVMVAGHYIPSALPVAPSDPAGSPATGGTTPSLSTLEAQGLHAQTWLNGTVTRNVSAENL